MAAPRSASPRGGCHGSTCGCLGSTCIRTAGSSRGRDFTIMPSCEADECSDKPVDGCNMSWNVPVSMCMVQLRGSDGFPRRIRSKHTRACTPCRTMRQAVTSKALYFAVPRHGRSNSARMDCTRSAYLALIVELPCCYVYCEVMLQGFRPMRHPYKIRL